MKPFDLEKALAGEPVVTRDGRPVTQLIKFKIDNYFPVAGVVDDEIQFFRETGTFLIKGEDPNDLFMATKTVKKEGWVVLWKYEKSGKAVYVAGVFQNKEEADVFVPPVKIATVKIEWEEEI